MDELEQQLFALELALSLRLALDGPDMRRRLADAIEAGMADASPTERRIRERALAIVGDGTEARAAHPIQLRGS